jgi:2-amino-4-hydroxy-6-hydroxymethyldihydropteridine diphosphokinase
MLPGRLVDGEGGQGLSALPAEGGGGLLRGDGLTGAVRFALALGSNAGDRVAGLLAAASGLRSAPGLSQLILSGIYETRPAEGVGGGPFLNAAVSGVFEGGGRGLRDLCRALESGAGSPVEKQGRERTLDIDVLFLEPPEAVEGLVLPHPRMARRRFVLVPLSEVWPRPVPGLGRTPHELLAACEDAGHITAICTAPAAGGLWNPCPNSDS